MRKFAVKLYEGNKLVTYKVAAESPEEAEDKALAYREHRFQQNTSREALELEKQQIQERVDAVPSELSAGLKGSRVGVNAAVSGAIDSVLNMGQGIASLWSKKDGGASVAKLQQLRDANLNSQIDYATRIHEQVAGRPLTAAEKLRTAEEQAKFVQRGKFATDIGVGVAGGVATLGAKTIKGMMALGTLEGGLGGYLMADTGGMEVDEGISKRIEEMSYGAILGAGLSIAPSFFVGAKNWVGNRITRAAGGREALEEARESLGRLGIFEASPAQLTGDPRLAVAEREAAGQLAQKMFAGQMDAAVQGVARQAGVQLPPVERLLEGSAPVIRSTMEAVQGALGNMRGERNKAFRSVLRQLAKDTDNKPVIPATQALAKMEAVMKEIGEEFGANAPLSGVIKDTFDDLRKAVDAGGLTPQKANALLSRLNGMQKSGFGIFDRTSDLVVGQEAKFAGFTKIKAKELKLGLMNAFDEAGQVFPELKAGREAYGAASQRIRAMEDATRETLAGGGNPARILKNLETADPAEARAFVQGLRQFEGGQEVIDGVNEYLVREAVRKASQAKVGAGLREGDFDLQVFVKELSASGEASRLKGLLLPEQEAALQKGLKNLRRLFNVPEFQGGVHRTMIPVDMQHVAINAISRDPGFMARVLGGAIQKGKGVESLFYTRAGQEILYNAVNFSLKAPKTAAAMQTANATVAYLASIQGAGLQLEQMFGAGDESQMGQ